MNQEHNHSEHNESQDANVQDRRELVRKLGKFAAYAAPFTVLALKGNASPGAGASGGGGVNSGVKSQTRRR